VLFSLVEGRVSPTRRPLPLKENHPHRKERVTTTYIETPGERHFSTFLGKITKSLEGTTPGGSFPQKRCGSKERKESSAPTAGKIDAESRTRRKKKKLPSTRKVGKGGAPSKGFRHLQKEKKSPGAGWDEAQHQHLSEE